MIVYISNTMMIWDSRKKHVKDIDKDFWSHDLKQRNMGKGPPEAIEICSVQFDYLSGCKLTCSKKEPPEGILILLAPDIIAIK